MVVPDESGHFHYDVVGDWTPSRWTGSTWTSPRQWTATRSRWPTRPSRHIKLSVLAERLVAAGTEHELVHPHNKLRVDRLLEEIAANPQRITSAEPQPAELAPTNPD